MKEKHRVDTYQFTQHDITRPIPVKAFTAFVAVWPNGENHTMIACPTVEALEEVWSQVTGQELNKNLLYHVEIIPVVEEERAAKSA